MKTADMLAKYLNEWPLKYSRIVQADDSIFYGVFAGNEMHCEAIPGERLAGLPLSEDHGTSVTSHDWIAAQRTEMEKGNVFDISRGVYAKEKSDDDYMREHLYNMKLQCLHAALIQNGQFDKTNATNIAEAINDGFDKINIPNQQTGRSEMAEYLKRAIGEGYQPEHEQAITDLSVIDGLADNDLNREFGKCWQWYNMGCGMHETFEETKQQAFQKITKPLIQWLNDNANPHAIIVIDPTSATLHTGDIGYSTEEFLKD
ncbi:hypothetical protein ACL0YQ_000959 [Citrobacter freundii]